MPVCTRFWTVMGPKFQARKIYRAGRRLEHEYKPEHTLEVKIDEAGKVGAEKKVSADVTKLAKILGKEKKGIFMLLEENDLIENLLVKDFTFMVKHISSLNLPQADMHALQRIIFSIITDLNKLVEEQTAKYTRVFAEGLVYLGVMNYDETTVDQIIRGYALTARKFIARVMNIEKHIDRLKADKNAVADLTKELTELKDNMDNEIGALRNLMVFDLQAMLNLYTRIAVEEKKIEAFMTQGYTPELGKKEIAQFNAIKEGARSDLKLLIEENRRVSSKLKRAA